MWGNIQSAVTFFNRTGRKVFILFLLFLFSHFPIFPFSHLGYLNQPNNIEEE
jgi:hypothetical protein